jgi:cation transport protein ChaC
LAVSPERGRDLAVIGLSFVSSDSVKKRKPSIFLEPADLANAFWVFAYGSLMWKPGFAFEERVPGLIRGFHRSLCIYSNRHRGTPERPGLVLGLDRGGACRGIAYRVGPEKVDDTRAYLTEREQINKVYLEAWPHIRLEDGRLVQGLAYVVDRRHPQYTGRLSHEEVLRLVRQGQGQSGECRDYVLNTVNCMAEIGVTDHALDWLKPALSSR